MSSSTTSPTSQPAPGAARAGGAPPIQRQFVNFSFYKLDPAFRRLSDHDKIQARAEFAELFQKRRPGMICLSYSTVGLRPETDFLLWRISMTPDDFQAQSQAINKSRLGAYL